MRIEIVFTNPLVFKTCDPSIDSALAHINRQLQSIMSSIQDFATKQNAHNDAIDTAIAGLTADNAALADLIKTLQNSAGSITPEDQATLDALEARTAKQADALAALDALTPPAAPTA